MVTRTPLYVVIRKLPGLFQYQAGCYIQ